MTVEDNFSQKTSIFIGSPKMDVFWFTMKLREYKPRFWAQ